MPSTFHFRPELLRAAELIDFRCKRKLSAAYLGNHESHFRGSGMQFKEFRPYEIGDDTRHISWITTAKTGKATLKLFEEEREINVFVLVDVSGSSIYGSGSQRKIDMYAETLALLGLGALKEKHRFGCLFFDKEIRHFTAPSRNKEFLLKSLNFLQTADLDSRLSDLRPALTFCNQQISHRSLVVIISDFLMNPFKSELFSLSLKHEIVLLQGFDDSERLISGRGISEICDPETGDFFVFDTESPSCRKALSAYYNGFTQQLEESAASCRADLLPMSVQDDYLQRLVHFFSGR